MRDRSKVKKTVPAQVPLATSCGAGSKPLRGARKLMNFSPTQLPYGKFCHRADAVNATAQKIALRANGNPQKSINFVHWSGGCGMNEITARLLTLRIAQFFLMIMRALRAFGFRFKFKKNCASAGNVSKH